jgi:hypothetical protein
VPEGISCKLRRARQHLEELHAAIEAFLKADPKPYKIVAHDDPQTRDRIYGLEILEQPPSVEWAVVTGDILHNLRSGLDHLANAMCRAHAPTETPPWDTEFPIFWSEDRFASVERGGGLYKIRGMGDEAQRAICELQPFRKGEWAKSQSLWLLQQMSNIDKHRSLDLAFLGYPMITAFEDPAVEIMPVWSRDGSEIARARPRTPDAEVKSDPIFIPQLIFNEEGAPPGGWRPLDSQLATFLRIVNEITEDLSTRFLGTSSPPSASAPPPPVKAFGCQGGPQEPGPLA